MREPCVPHAPALPGMKRLPCGCQMGKSGEVLLYIPCSKSCTYYQYLKDQAAEDNKPLIKIGDESDLPD